MNRLFLTVVLATVTGFSLLAQSPNVSIKLDTAERFRFEGNRLNFLNPGRNVLIGDSTGFFMEPEASGNVYIGSLTGLFDSLGFLNTFVGSQAGYSNRTGHRNTFIGFGAGQSNTTGYRNTFIGLSAGVFNTEGSLNTYIGRTAGYYNQTGIGNVFIGNAAGQNELGSNRLYIANTSTDAPLIYGDFYNSYLRFNAINTETTGDFSANGNVAAGSGFSVNEIPGVNDTVNMVTGIDFTNGLLRYKTQIFKGGLLVYASNESEWVNAVGEIIMPCGEISLLGEFSGWSLDQMMNRSEANPAVWTTYMFLSAGNDFMPADGIVDMKFRENQNWAVNWGSTNFPSGTGINDGPNIPVPLNPNFTTTVYFVTFNCTTGEYNFTDVSQ